MFTASARRIPNPLRHEMAVNDRHTLITDEPIRLGGTDLGPAPHELLPAMLAACASTVLAMYAERKGWSLDGVRVDVSYDPDAVPRRVQIMLHLPDGLSADQVERLRRVGDELTQRDLHSSRAA